MTGELSQSLADIYRRAAQSLPIDEATAAALARDGLARALAALGYTQPTLGAQIDAAAHDESGALEADVRASLRSLGHFAGLTPAFSLPPSTFRTVEPFEAAWTLKVFGELLGSLPPDAALPERPRVRIA
jgi:hypothetical protein